MKTIIKTILTCCVFVVLFSCHKETYENDNTPTILWTEYINNNGNQNNNYPLGTEIVAHYSDHSLAFFCFVWNEENEINCIGNLFNKKSYTFVVPETILIREANHWPHVSLAVVSIGGNAFDSRITSITLPNSIKRIEPNAFEGCSSLTSITLPNSIQEIGSFAFEGCSLEMVSIKHNYIKESLFKDVFQNCSTGSLLLYFNDGLIQIGRNAFEGCSALTNVIFPDGLKEIGREAFKGCSALTNVIFPDGLKEIGSEAFEDCSSLTNISLPSSIKKADYNAFDNCPLETITIREGIDTIRGSAFQGAFYQCSSQSLSIILPEGLRFIGIKAFANCISLTSCTCYAVNPPTIDFYPWFYFDPAYPFENTSLLAIYVPRESVETYKTAEGWEHYADIIYPIE